MSSYAWLPIDLTTIAHALDGFRRISHLALPQAFAHDGGGLVHGVTWDGHRRSWMLLISVPGNRTRGRRREYPICPNGIAQQQRAFIRNRNPCGRVAEIEADRLCDFPLSADTVFEVMDNLANRDRAIALSYHGDLVATRVHRVVWNPRSQAFEVRASHPSFDRVAPGAEVPWEESPLIEVSLFLQELGFDELNPTAKPLSDEAVRAAAKIGETPPDFRAFADGLMDQVGKSLGLPPGVHLIDFSAEPAGMDLPSASKAERPLRIMPLDPVIRASDPVCMLPDGSVARVIQYRASCDVGANPPITTIAASDAEIRKAIRDNHPASQEDIDRVVAMANAAAATAGTTAAAPHPCRCDPAQFMLNGLGCTCGGY